MTQAIAQPSRTPWAIWLMGLYIVALLALPVDFGVSVGAVIVTPSRVILLAAVALALVGWRSSIAALRSVPRLVWVGWLAFLGAALVAAILAPSTASWARYASLLGEGLVVFALVWNAATAPGGLRTLVVVFAVTMIVVAGVVLLLAALGMRYDKVLADIAGNVPLADTAPRFGIERQPGPFRGPLFFAIWMTAASALLMPALAEGRARLRQLAFAAWLVLLVSVVFLTASRLAMSAMFVVPGVYFLVRGRRLVALACFIAAGAVAIGVTFLAPASEVVARSGEMRLSAIDAALQAIRARPLFGWGLLSDQSVLSGLLGTRSYVDDTYLSLAVETGLVGLGAFLLLATSIVAATRRTWRSPLVLAVTIAVAGVLGMAAFASVLQASQGYAAFAVLAALAVAAGSDAARSQPPIQIDQRP